MTRDLFPDIPFRRLGYYVLDGRRPVQASSFLEWAEFMEDREARTVAQDFFVNVEPWLSRDLKKARRIKPDLLGEAWRQAQIEAATQVMVSTVFLGFDHGWGDGPPIVFETMIFHGPLSDEQHRYADWDTAEAGHKATVERVIAALTEKVE